MDKLINISDRTWEYSDIEYWTNPKDNTCNAIIEFNGKKTRLRSGILIVKDAKYVLLGEEKGEENIFALPGGGLEEHETLVASAIREAQEEAYVNVRDAKETGYDYCEINDEVMDWVKENIPEDKWWYNYYTCLIIADYDSPYTGKVDAVDRDPAMRKSVKWYPIEEVINLPSFREQWKKALVKFGYTQIASILTEEPKMKKKYSYNGPIFRFDRFVGNISLETMAVSEKQAKNNFIFKAAEACGYSRALGANFSIDESRIIERSAPITEPAKPVERKETHHEKCALCGTLLNDAGECPVCDLGDESALEEGLQGFENVEWESIRRQIVNYINQVIDEDWVDPDDFKVIDIQPYGSRRRRTAKKSSDLDIVVEYEGNMREDDAFNMLNDHSRRLKIWSDDIKKDILVDINPINADRSEDMKSFLARANEYDQEILKTKKSKLTEETRTSLVSKSRSVGQYKDQSRGKNRFERKKFSKVANAVKQYNKIDMNKLFKSDILEVIIPVMGETDSYDVTIRMEGVIEEIAKNVKNNRNKFEYRTVIQSLTKIFNTKDIFVRCTCKDFKYRFEHWSVVNNYGVTDTAHDPGPGRGIANPNNDKGKGCKHILLVLANGDWMMKVASVINNYVHYAEANLKKAFLDIIFPKIYGIPADDMVEQDVVGDEKFINDPVGLIDAANEYGRNRGKIQKGSNKNPVAQKERSEKKPEKDDADKE